MTEDAEELSGLIGDIYDASLDQNLWPMVLQRFCEFVGGKTSGLIAGLYRLTPAELRVLMMIIDIGGVPEVAPVLGVSQRTVKTHLKHVFEKTGTRRQADLVKLVVRFMNPTG